MTDLSFSGLFLNHVEFPQFLKHPFSKDPYFFFVFSARELLPEIPERSDGFGGGHTALRHLRRPVGGAPGATPRGDLEKYRELVGQQCRRKTKLVAVRWKNTAQQT